MIIYLLEYVVTELPSFWKEGCPTGGVVGKAWFACCSYHLPLRVLLLPEGGELANHFQLHT